MSTPRMNARIGVGLSLNLTDMINKHFQNDDTSTLPAISLGLRRRGDEWHHVKLPASGLAARKQP